MPETMQLTFADGGTIAVEVNDAPRPGGAGRGGADMMPSAQVVKTADEAFGSLARIANCLQTALKDSKPDSVTVSFSCNFSAAAGVVIAKGSADASLNITMVWNKG